MLIIFTVRWNHFTWQEAVDWKEEDRRRGNYNHFSDILEFLLNSNLFLLFLCVY